MSVLGSVSIVIVAYHSRRDLERCLPSIYSQDYQPLEVIIVDNSPSDGTAEWLQYAFPNVGVVPNPTNTGYAGGNNLGFSHVKGDFVLVLNPDTELYPGSLAVLAAAIRQQPRALITAKLLNPDGSINACGLNMHYTGLTTCRGLGQAPESYSSLHEVPLVSGAAFIAATQVLHELGGFDETYFMYLEDMDLSLRARLQGLDILCVGDALVTHDYELAMSPRKFYCLERNRLLTLFKLYQAKTLWQIAPALLLTELATWAFALIRGPRYLTARARGYATLWSQRADWRLRRKEVQDRRKIDDRHLLRNGLAQLPFEQLVSSRQIVNLLDTLTRPLYEICYRWIS